MATSLGTTTLTVETLRRTWRINIETSIGTIPVLTAHREAKGALWSLAITAALAALLMLLMLP